MTQDEKWLLQYEQMMAFMNENHRRPSKHRLEEHDMLNWFKATKKRIAKGTLPADRLEKFHMLLEVAEKYQRKNQYQYKDLITSTPKLSESKKCVIQQNNVIIRKAVRRDVPLLLEFINGIAQYEKMENDVIASADVLEREMFDEHRAEAVFAVVDGREVGFALYFYNFSTFIGHSGLYLEDLFVWPDDRGKGYGKALLLHLVKIAREHHCGRMEWSCLNWNQPSIDFYLSLGAVPMKEWTVYRLDAAALERLS